MSIHKPAPEYKPQLQKTWIKRVILRLYICGYISIKTAQRLINLFRVGSASL